jgi:MFS family permease
MTLSEKNSTIKTFSVGTLTYSSAGIVALFCWLLWGDFAWAMKERAVGSVATLMVKSFGVSDFVFSLLIISFPNFTNIFLMPIISYRSDRYRSKYGRRIPFLLATTPFVVIGLIGLGFTPILGRLLHEAIGVENISYNMAALTIFVVFWIILDFGTTLTNAIFMALANDVVPTKLVGRFMALFRVVSLGAAVFFNYFVLGYAETYSLMIFVSLGFLYGVGLFTMCAKVKEGGYPPPPSAPAGGRGFFVAAKNYFKECYSNSYYLLMFSYFTLGTLALSSFGPFAILYAKHLNVPMAQYGKATAVMLAISLVLTYFVGAVADRFHPLRATLVALLLYGITLIGGYFFVVGPQSFLVVFVIQGIIAGCYGTASISLPMRVMPRVAFAQFNSASGMITCIFVILYIPMMGKFLDFTHQQYNYTLIIGAGITFAAVICGLFFYRKFNALGGVRSYEAPIPPSLSR